MKYILALDQGTTSSRAILFGADGQVHNSVQREFRQIYPRSGWVEHDPNEVWSSQRGVAVEALTRAGLKRSDIAAVGITNQRETTVVWDRKTGQPVSNAIVWQDRRTAGFCEELKAESLDSTFREKTGLLVDPYFSGTKVRWILDNVPGAREKAERGDLAFGTVDSWLVWKLTSGQKHLTDATNACRTLLFNIHTGDWDPELLDILRIPQSMLPEVRSCSEIYGEISEGGFMSGVPIAGIAGDQHAALFGQICTKPGMAKNTYGTGCFVLMNTGDEKVLSENNLLTTIAWKIGDHVEYALEGSIFIAGAVVQWLRDELRIIRTSAEVEKLAAEVPDTGGVCFVPAFAGLGAPHWDANARGAIIGMTRGTSAAHIARAALESIAFQSYDVLNAMERDSGIRLRELRVDGGACLNDLLMQFQADLLQVPVVRPKITETTALGAAYLAGLAVGFWKNQEEIAEHWEAEKEFAPRETADLEKRLSDWRKALDRAKGWEE